MLRSSDHYNNEDVPTHITDNNNYEIIEGDQIVATGAEDQGKAGTSNPLSDSEWLQMAKQTFSASSSYIETNLSAQWAKNLANFHSRHPAGSKYHTPAYAHRHRGFRPKTRAMSRRNEAACVNAFFSTSDIIDVSAENDADDLQRAGAAMMGEVMEYRLAKTIPWLLTVVGALQDTMVNNVCISRQYWDYQELPDGTVIKDEPVIDLIPVENFRFSPSADWRKPAEDSPYLIHMIPMYAVDVRTKMRSIDPKTEMPEWNKADEEAMFHATKSEYNATRLAREKNGTDSQDVEDVKDHETVWVHRYIIRHEGEDWEFYTLGTGHLLTNPRLLSENEHGGWRDYVVGFSIIETHKTYPSGLVELGQELQAEANDISNQRRDNVALAMNKRFLHRREGAVDLRALSRSVPGGSVAVRDPNNDVKVLETNDVTGSSYQEQDRVNVDFDEITGTFSQGSVQSNRALNETVGGMEMLTNDSNVLTEYQLRVFSTTWVEPVLYQILRLEQAYESDNVILAIAAEKSELYDEFKINMVTPELLTQDLTLNVNVGTDSTNPARAAERLMYGVQTAQNLGEPLDNAEIIKEVFGKMGYRDGERFMLKQDQQQPPPQDPMIELKKQELQMKQELEMMRLQQDRELEMVRLSLTGETTMAQIEAKLSEAKMKDQTARDVQAAKSMDLQDERAIKNIHGFRHMTEPMTEGEIDAALHDTQLRDEAENFKKTRLYTYIIDRAKKEEKEAIEELIHAKDEQTSNEARRTIDAMRIFQNIMDAVIQQGEHAEFQLQNEIIEGRITEY